MRAHPCRAEVEGCLKFPSSLTQFLGPHCFEIGVLSRAEHIYWSGEPSLLWSPDNHKVPSDSRRSASSGPAGEDGTHFTLCPGGRLVSLGCSDEETPTRRRRQQTSALSGGWESTARCRQIQAVAGALLPACSQLPSSLVPTGQEESSGVSSSSHKGVKPLVAPSS